MPREEFIGRLRLDLEARLTAIDEEGRRIRRALAALRSPVRVGRGGGAGRTDELLEALRQQPESRASVLALASGTTVEVVSSELRLLEEKGVVATDGTRWRLVN